MDEREIQRRIQSLQHRMGELETRAGQLGAERELDPTRQFAEEQRLWQQIWELQREIARLEQRISVARTRRSPA